MNTKVKTTPVVHSHLWIPPQVLIKRYKNSSRLLMGYLVSLGPTTSLSNQELAKSCNLSVKTVARCLNELELNRDISRFKYKNKRYINIRLKISIEKDGLEIPKKVFNSDLSPLQKMVIATRVNNPNVCNETVAHLLDSDKSNVCKVQNELVDQGVLDRPRTCKTEGWIVNNLEKTNNTKAMGRGSKSHIRGSKSHTYKNIYKRELTSYDVSSFKSSFYSKKNKSAFLPKCPACQEGKSMHKNASEKSKDTFSEELKTRQNKRGAFPNPYKKPSKPRRSPLVEFWNELEGTRKHKPGTKVYERCRQLFKLLKKGKLFPVGSLDYDFLMSRGISQSLCLKKWDNGDIKLALRNVAKLYHPFYAPSWTVPKNLDEIILNPRTAKSIFLACYVQAPQMKRTPVLDYKGLESYVEKAREICRLDEKHDHTILFKLRIFEKYWDDNLADIKDRRFTYHYPSVAAMMGEYLRYLESEYGVKSVPVWAIGTDNKYFRRYMDNVKYEFSM